MVTEIELKARVSDRETLLSLLFKKAEYRGAFVKDDTYWYPSCPTDLPPTGLRIRIEDYSHADRTESLSTLVTFKNKTITQGIEINDEREFRIYAQASSRAGAFEELIRLLGLKQKHAKKKRGWDFSCEGITVELTEVEGLGWFIEMEILTNNNSEETLADGKKRLLAMLSSFGVKSEAIESKSYTEMLAENSS